MRWFVTLVGQCGTSRAIQQPSRSSHHTTQSHKPPIFPAVYIYSSRASFVHAQRLDSVRGHRMPRLRHPTLTCSTVETSGPEHTGRCSYSRGRSFHGFRRVLACATPTCISRQTRAASSSGAALAALPVRQHALMLHLSSDAHLGADPRGPVRRHASIV